MKKYKLLIKAYKEHYAIPQFNIVNAEYTRYILEESERLKSPVILGVSEKVAKHIGGFLTAKCFVEGLKKDLNITVPVILHLDHGRSIEACEKAIAYGFDSVMLDFSTHTLEENIKGVKYLTSKYRDIIVEAEIGAIGKNGNEGIIYSDLKDLIELSKKSKCHTLAPAIGNVHGVYKGKPKLNFELLKDINNSIKKPLVLHGGSGLKEKDIKECIKNGISKININTELKKAWTNAIKKELKDNPKDFDPVYIIEATEKSIKKVVCDHIKMFGSENKS